MLPDSDMICHVCILNLHDAGHDELQKKNPNRPINNNKLDKRVKPKVQKNNFKSSTGIGIGIMN